MTSSISPCAANEKRRRRWHAHRSCLSIGIEPCPEYLPAGFAPNPAGYRNYFIQLVAATRPHVAALKFNLAFFEALGPDGTRLLYDLREALDADELLLIADAKRSDIGSSARRYAESLYTRLAVDSATVNPLMGADTVMPFLEYTEKLTFALALTSNPGAVDFLRRADLDRAIVERLSLLDSNGCLGFVVGATQSDRAASLRELAAHRTFLIPGIGSQGGQLEQVLLACARPHTPEVAPPALIHITRDLVPPPDHTGDPIAYALDRIQHWNARIAASLPA